MLWFGWLTGGGYDSYSFFCSVFLLLLNVLSWLVCDKCCVCLIASFLLSLLLVPLIRCD